MINLDSKLPKKTIKNNILGYISCLLLFFSIFSSLNANTDINTIDHKNNSQIIKTVDCQKHEIVKPTSNSTFNTAPERLQIAPKFAFLLHNTSYKKLTPSILSTVNSVCCYQPDNLSAYFINRLLQ